MGTNATTTAVTAGARAGQPAERWAAARLGRWRWILPLMPAMLSFGPLFMVIGPNATVANYVGAVMVSVGLIAQFIIMSRMADNPASSGEAVGNEASGNDGADKAASPGP